MSGERKPKSLGDENTKTEGAAGRDYAGQFRSERCRFKKVVTPDVKRDAVPHIANKKLVRLSAVVSAIAALTSFWLGRASSWTWKLQRLSREES